MKSEITIKRLSETNTLNTRTHTQQLLHLTGKKRAGTETERETKQNKAKQHNKTETMLPAFFCYPVIICNYLGWAGSESQT